MKNRHSIRFPGYDYSSEGLYFVTVCTKDKENLFGQIVGEKMTLNNSGRIVERVWNELQNRYDVLLDQFQIMPNHIHGILLFVGAHHDAPKTIVIPDRIGDPSVKRAIRESPLRRSLLSQVIGYFKMNSSKKIHAIDPNINVWQRNYYEHIIRNEIELNKIREYIQTNPDNWERDEENLIRVR